MRLDCGIKLGGLNRVLEIALTADLGDFGVKEGVILVRWAFTPLSNTKQLELDAILAVVSRYHVN